MPLSMDDLMKPPPPTATIYISGFGEDTKQEALLKHFGQIGVIKKHKETGAPDIFLYKDEAGLSPDTMPSSGCCIRGVVAS
jgi:RNA recognition motif-containing protein